MSARKMKELSLDTTRANGERSAATSEASVSTPFSSISYASTSRTDSGSDHGPDTVLPEDDISVKFESSPPDTPLDSQHTVTTPVHSSRRSKHRVQKERASSDDTRKLRVNERSKTGCITCRKRKKKCDETKPHCLNCSKTNYKCEGYVSRRDWKPTGRRGSNKSEEETDILLELPQQRSLPALPAIENEIDTKFFKHYIERTSLILCINTEDESNPWTDLILPLAKDDQCLMHFVLALAGSHWKMSAVDRSLSDRQLFHQDAAIKQLRQRLPGVKPGTPDSEPLMASMILHFLMSKSGGEANAQPQGCLKAARSFLQPPETDFWRFAWEFCTQYEFSTNLTSLPGVASRPTFEQLEGMRALNAGAGSTTNGCNRLDFGVLAGIIDVAFMTMISKITILRDQIRDRQLSGQAPLVNYRLLTTADELGQNIAAWQSEQPEGTARHVAAELYRQASLLYLLRTVRSTRKPESRISFGACVGYGLECLELLPADDPVQSGLLLPTFILGCGAFEPDHRSRLGKSLDRIEEYSGFGNVRAVRKILERVWDMMAREDDRSWDWESVMHDMGYDTLVA